VIQKSVTKCAFRMTGSCSCLISILETVRTRCCNTLEAQVGHGCSKRLISHLVTGRCKPIEAVLRSWVDGVVMEHTSDPDIICVSRILLSLFIEEACALKTTNYKVLKAFCLQWIHRCILRLGVGVAIHKQPAFLMHNIDRIE